MGIHQVSNMKAFLCFAIFATASADQAHHQVVKIGNAPSVSSAVHKAHGAGVATVSSQPHAAPQSVKGYRNTEKYAAAVAAPAAPIVHAAPAYHAPVHAPAYKEPAYDEPA